MANRPVAGGDAGEDAGEDAAPWLRPGTRPKDWCGRAGIQKRSNQNFCKVFSMFALMFSNQTLKQNFREFEKIDSKIIVFSSGIQKNLLKPRRKSPEKS